MRVVVTGSSGLIGTALLKALAAAGHQSIRLVRREPASPDELQWDPSAGTVDVVGLEGHDAVVHLAGVGIGEHRWTPAHKAAVVESRVGSTKLLVQALTELESPPRVLASGSAVGIYGDRGDEVLTEGSPVAAEATGGFLAGVVRDWEATAAPAAEAGIRVATLRSGVVLSTKGGALQKQLLPFKLGLAGRIGSGRQYLSWIDVDDHVAGIIHVLENDAVQGPVNLTAPEPVTNSEFTTALGRALRRPTVVPVPTLALNALFGREMVGEMMLGGQRVVPEGLTSSGFVFRYPDIAASLGHQLRS